MRMAQSNFGLNLPARDSQSFTLGLSKYKMPQIFTYLKHKRFKITFLYTSTIFRNYNLISYKFLVKSRKTSCFGHIMSLVPLVSEMMWILDSDVGNDWKDLTWSLGKQITRQGKQKIFLTGPSPILSAVQPWRKNNLVPC